MNDNQLTEEQVTEIKAYLETLKQTNEFKDWKKQWKQSGAGPSSREWIKIWNNFDQWLNKKTWCFRTNDLEAGNRGTAFALWWNEIKK